MVLDTDSALDDLLPDVDCEQEGYLVLSMVSGQDLQQPGAEYEQESYFADDSGLCTGLKGAGSPSIARMS